MTTPNRAVNFLNLIYSKFFVAGSQFRIFVLNGEGYLRIRTAIETITADMIQTVWNELDYRVDVCRIT